MSVPRRRSRTYLRADDRKAQIVEVARSVFARRGVRDAQIADICEAAKIGRGTLYQYFENKHDVIVAVVDQICARIAAELDRRLPIADLPGVDKAPLEMIVAVTSRRMQKMLDAVFVDEATLRFVLRDARGVDGAVDAMLARIDALLLGAMEKDIRAAQQAGVVRADVDCRLAAQFVLGGVEKVVLSSLSADVPVDREKLVQKTVEMQLFGLLDPEVRR